MTTILKKTHLVGQVVPTAPRAPHFTLDWTAEYQGTVYSVRFSAGGRLLAAGCDGIVRIFEIQTREEICVLEHSVSTGKSPLPVRSICFTQNGKYLAAGGDDGGISIWDLETYHAILCLAGHTGAINTLESSPDSRLIVSGSSDATVRVWETDTWEYSILEIIGSRKSNYDVTSVIVSTDGQWLAAGSFDGVIRIWDLATKTLIERLRGHQEPILAMSFNFDGSKLISSSCDDGNFKYWNIQPMVDAVTDAVSSEGLSSLSLKQDKKQSVHRWPIPEDKKDGIGELGSYCMSSFEPEESEGHELLSMAVSPYGPWAVSGVEDGTVQFWNPSEAKIPSKLELEGQSGHVTSMMLRPLQKILATASDDGYIRICKSKRRPQPRSSQNIDALTQGLILKRRKSTTAFIFLVSKRCRADKISL
ncbi:WD40 repeat-like protein [Clavulina sp. PMI_390]|nr:WD40 repeat-like protein [Clavulina sp. PMI_390]